MARVFLIIISLCLPIGSAFANHMKEYKEVSLLEAKIVVHLDWWWAGPEYGGWSEAWAEDYGKFTQYAWWRNGVHPRLELLLERLAPGQYWNRVPDISEDSLRAWNHLSEADLSELETLQCIARHCIRFTRSGIINCIAFRFLTGPFGDRRGGDRGTDIVAGYYCASPFQEIPVELVDTIINGIEVRG